MGIYEAWRGMLTFTQTYWYLFVILFFGILAFVFIMKYLGEKRKTHDEVKRHHKELSQEDKFNKTWYEWFYIGTRLVGKLKATKITGRTIFEKKYDHQGKMTKKQEDKIKFLYLSIKTAKLGLTKRYSFWFSEEHLNIPYDLISYDSENKSIIVDSSIHIEKYKNYKIPTIYKNEENKKYIDSEFSKGAMDYEVNAHANQLIKFSSIHHEFGHDIRKLEKEAEVERAKKERKRVA